MIKQNELRKAHRLTDLMVQLNEQDQVTEAALNEVVLLTNKHYKYIIISQTHYILDSLSSELIALRRLNYLT